MPELPEVETVRRGLEKAFRNQPVVRDVVLMRGDIRFPIPKDIPDKMKDQPILGVRRRAKYLFFDLPTGSLLSHLGMTGTWREIGEEGTTKHDHFFIELEDGRIFAFRDPRRFGVIDWLDKNGEASHKLLKNLGPEPLEKTWNALDLFNKSRRRTSAIKVFIMDQRILVGVGNIYASEVLFRAGVKPTKLTGKVSKLEWQRLEKAIRQVLHESIKAGGSTISDYRTAGGDEGEFQKRFRVYDREGKPCVKCKSMLKAKVIGGRSTFWCAKCQK
jgi:formamidopyrimidine-DNA glycosylase